MPGHKKPTKLLKMQGTWRKDRHGNKNEPQPPAANLAQPYDLDEDGQRFWDYHAPKLSKLGLLSENDAYALAMAAEWFSIHQKCVRELRSGISQKTPTTTVAKPASVVAKAAIVAVRGFLADFGLTPASRTRLTVEPPEEVDPIFERFFKKGA